MAGNVFQLVHQATLALLERTGVGLDSDLALDLCAAHGVPVDARPRRVHLLPRQVDEALATAPRRVAVCGRGEEKPLLLGGESVHILSDGCSGATSPTSPPARDGCWPRRAPRPSINSNYAGPPMVSPALYRDWDRPVLEVVVAACHERGVPLQLHQHGHALAVIDEIVAAGVSLVCPLLPPPQGDVADLAAVKRCYRGRIALKGNVDPIAVLLHCTPHDVEQAVWRCIDAAADSAVVGTPFRNIEAFVEAGLRYGRY